MSACTNYTISVYMTNANAHSSKYDKLADFLAGRKQWTVLDACVVCIGLRESDKTGVNREDRDDVTQ